MNISVRNIKATIQETLCRMDKILGSPIDNIRRGKAMGARHNSNREESSLVDKSRE